MSFEVKSPKKLIEVALPLDIINEAAAREKSIRHGHPTVEITKEMAVDRPDLEPLIGQKLTVIAWIWARTVKSPNPAFSHVDVPLASTFILSSKTGKEAYVQPVVNGDSYQFKLKIGTPPPEAKNGTKLARGANFKCIVSGTSIEPVYIYKEANEKRMGERLMAVVAEGTKGRVYLSPIQKMEGTAKSAKPVWKPDVPMPENPRWFSPPLYGLKTYGDLFTDRQLVALTTFSDLVTEAKEKIKNDFLPLGNRASCSNISEKAHSSNPIPSTPPAAPNIPITHLNPQKPFPYWHSRGCLPHFEGGEIPQSINFRLADTLPQSVLKEWEEELKSLPDTKAAIQRRKRIEKALDNGIGECRLKDKRVAKIVEDALLHFDTSRYRLHVWSIMPNHVHVIITPLNGYTLSSILHSWKSFTSKECNKVLNREGTFWAEEYFDRFIRDARHFYYAKRYIEQNPVKAGLVEKAEDWEFGSAWREMQGDGEESERARCSLPQGLRTASVLQPDDANSQNDNELPLEHGGVGAVAYAEAISMYLAFGVDRLADRCSTICSWDNGYTKIRNTFGRQAIPMTWDYCEGNPFSDSTGNFTDLLEWVKKYPDQAPTAKYGYVEQMDAQNQNISGNKIVSTDPPYYDNIGYADLSDFFYVWLRCVLQPVFPTLFATIAVPKREELIATPYRHNSKDAAEKYFLNGMTNAIKNFTTKAHPEMPVTIYYAFKQAETEKVTGTASTGWETFLSAVINSGLVLNGTWPMRTELSNRLIGSGTNALASSIVLVCRKRSPNASTISRREFIRELNKVLPEALDEMTKGSGDDRSPVAPVDLSQAIIGPGMAVFSKYSAVLEADGTPMTVKTALQLINRFLAEDDFDPDTQFCLHWFDQYGWGEGVYGQADVLARAKSTSVNGLADAGVVESGSGVVRLKKWGEYPAEWNPLKDNRMPVWETLHHLIRALKQDGETAAGKFLGTIKEKSEAARQLAYRLYTLCERQGWAEDARAYNELITSWAGIETSISEENILKSQTTLEI